MKKFYCAEKDMNGNFCPFICLQYEKGEIVVISRHKTGGRIQSAKHTNYIPIETILEEAVKCGDGIYILEQVLQFLGKNNLTEAFE